MRTVHNVANGQVLPDCSGLDLAQAVARQRELEGKLAATRLVVSRQDERKRLLVEVESVAARIRELKEARKAENARRSFAGIGSLLHKAMVAKLGPALVAEIEADAMARLDGLDRQKAAKTASEGASK